MKTNIQQIHHGFSTFDIYEIGSKDLYKYFKEFKENEKQCEFVGCTYKRTKLWNKKGITTRKYITKQI